MGAALIVFREVLEAALIVAIVMGASRGVVGRGRWVSAGIAAGVRDYPGAVLEVFGSTLAAALVIGLRTTVSF